MTFSIVARCPETGSFGVAVSSSSPAVAARCAFVRAGVGAVTSQNITDPALGVTMLDQMSAGRSAHEAIGVASGHRFGAYRQLTAVDAKGQAATFSGDHVLGLGAEATAPDVAAAGNLLVNDGVPAAMVADFLSTTGQPLAARILSAMQAALNAGGEAGPVHSAGMKIVRDVPWPIVDLRVDWTDDCPIAGLHDLWLRYEPQVEDYVMRAINPALAPSYGVPGDP